MSHSVESQPLARAELIVQRPTHPYILSVDTATEKRSVALCRGPQLVALREGGVAERGHSARLLAEIDEVLRRGQVRLPEIELFAVAGGPGSFTGLRAGLATCKAFAATLGRPLAAVPTLHAVALAAAPAPQVWAALPAGRGEVFAQLLAVQDHHTVLELGGPSHLSPGALAERAASLGVSLKWAGDGAWAQAERLREFAQGAGISWRVEGESEAEPPRAETVGVVWTLAPQVESYAELIAGLAHQLYRAGAELRVADVRALYVRLSDAEIKEQCRVSDS